MENSCHLGRNFLMKFIADYPVAKNARWKKLTGIICRPTKFLLEVYMVDLATLKRAHKIAARIVVEFGDVYLPIFERLQKEIQAVESNLDLKAQAILAALKE
ncbi:hypothetical protein [Mucilaginibacter psychrotolerans]|uniref:Uncharacterized protein n=1 Tax=Mucilaginibacter psychrotolerans TaxID=1524096 RepID=A0A4Y8SAS7_9SPHI|nr:hypothetical protein [Mucilaginibacter psychrotolerans]TFF36183.1 hypothetical protein E2R66_16715 [Mucilaginibacter psychrotolerans]